VTQDANDKPLSASGKMRVYKLLPGDKEEKVFEDDVQTDEKGRVFWTWPSDQSGQFRIAYEATTRGIKKSWHDHHLDCRRGLEHDQLPLAGRDDCARQAQLSGRPKHQGAFSRRSANTTVLFTQEAGGDILRRDVYTIEGKSREITIPVRHEHVPNFALAAAVVKNFEVYQAQAEVFVPPVQQLINVKVKGDKSEYKPGETGRFTIQATDYKGDPARAEVSVALTDASLFYIQKDYAPDIRTFYYGERRANSVNLDSSRSGQPQGRVEDDAKYTEYEQHDWELPDEMGQLNFHPGAGLGNGGGFYSRGNERQLRRSGAWQTVFNAASPALTMPSSEADSTLSMSAPASAAPARRMAAKARSGAGAENSKLAQAQVRSNFAETAFWSPAVVTENGTAQVSVKFPDSLTQWHAQARGLTATAQVGAGENDVETRKDLLVRLQAPRFFVQHDQVVLTANVHNDTKRSSALKSRCRPARHCN
jgi:hypothetical protein